MTKPKIGFVGVGLMGHGVARNILERGGYALTILGGRNRQPVDDLVGRGAEEAASPADLARRSDVVFLCLPSSREVEATVDSETGLMAGLRAGAIVVDTTTADPSVTRRIGGDLARRDVAMLDAALGRSPREAEAGKLASYVGGDADVVARVRPIMETYCDTIVHCGPLGAGTTCKLVNNSVTIGMVALFAEAFATAAKSGVDLNALSDVLSAGGADGKMWKMLEPWVRSGDDTALKGNLKNAAKDVRTYTRLAEDAGVAIYLGQAVNQTMRLALNRGYGDAFLPKLPGIIAELNGGKIRDL